MNFNQSYDFVKNVFFARDLSALKKDFSLMICLTGEDGGNIYLSYIDGVKYIEPEKNRTANITLTMSMETFSGICSGTIDGLKAFTTGQIQAKGNVVLAISIYNALKS